MARRMDVVTSLLLGLLVSCGGDGSQIVFSDNAFVASTTTRTPVPTSVLSTTTTTAPPTEGCTVPGLSGLPFKLGQTSDEIGVLKEIVSKNWALFWEIFNPPLDNTFDESFKALIELIQGGEGLPETGVVDAYTYREAVWPALGWLEPCS